jgi:hypothetical protein
MAPAISALPGSLPSATLRRCGRPDQTTGANMNALAVARDVITILGLLTGLYLFVLRREFYPRAEFNVSMRILGERDNELLLELAATVKNLGLVRHTIDEFTFSLRGLEAGHPWVPNTDRNDLIDFPRVLQRGDWVREEYITVIEPNVEQKFYFTVKVSPANVEYFNLYANMVYAARRIPDHAAAITKSIAELKKQHAELTQLPPTKIAAGSR